MMNDEDQVPGIAANPHHLPDTVKGQTSICCRLFLLSVP